jgi:hypothetical protein
VERVDLNREKPLFFSSHKQGQCLGSRDENRARSQ